MWNNDTEKVYIHPPALFTNLGYFFLTQSIGDI